MALSDVKSQFQGILNRRDITATLTTTFITQAIQRIQRNLRLPAMEKLVTVTMDGVNPLYVPGDMLELISMSYQSGTEGTVKLVGATLDKVQSLSLSPGNPTHYYRVGGVYKLGPVPTAGVAIDIHYYADASVLSNDTDSNWITAIAQDCVVYGALSYACDYFLDPRVDRFEGRFNQIMADLQDMANMEILTGNATIQPGLNMSVGT